MPTLLPWLLVPMFLASANSLAKGSRAATMPPRSPTISTELSPLADFYVKIGLDVWQGGAYATTATPAVIAMYRMGFFDDHSEKPVK